MRAVARRLADASSVSILEDLGIQQAPHSTLNSYLEKLLFLLTGNFGKPGGMNLHTGIGKLGGDFSRDTATPVSGERIIIGLVPGNVIPDEILTDDPNRLRAMIVESSNPAHSLADSQRMRAALEQLDLVVVLDIAMTETARLADYVLPSPSQFEKWEASFFCLEFPSNAFQLRRPVMPAPAGLLSEDEIHSRLVRAAGALEGIDLDGLSAAAERSRADYAAMLFGLVAEQPELRRLLPVIVHETLGPTLPAGAAAASALWLQAHGVAQMMPDSVRRAGFEGEGLELGEALFEAILSRESGLVFTLDGYEETWNRVANTDRRVALSVPELLDELVKLADEPEVADPDFPFVLSAGERRSHTANTIYRDPAWRKTDAEGALRLHPSDAERLGIADGGLARLTTKRASVETVVEVTDSLQPGYITLPNGLGTSYPEADGAEVVHGVAPNELTASEDRDWLAGTPHHKHVRARVEALQLGGHGDRLRSRFGDQHVQDGAQLAAGLLVGKGAVRLESRVGVTEGDLAIHHARAHRGKDLAQLGLRPHGAKRSRAGTNDCHRLVAQHVRGKGAGDPVERVLELPGNGRVVLGRREQHGVSAGDRRAQLRDSGRRRTVLIILVIGRHRLQERAQSSSSTSRGASSAAARSRRVLCESGRRLPDIPRTRIVTPSSRTARR